MKAILLLGVAAALSAQIEQANLTGVVNDQSGAVVPGAAVVLENRETKVKAETQTNASGGYRLPFLKAGEYDLTVTKAGFANALVQLLHWAGLTCQSSTESFSAYWDPMAPARRP